MQAFAAPLSWATLTTQDKNSMDSNDYRKLMWAVTPMAGLMPFLKTKLLMNVDIPKLKNMWVCFYGIILSGFFITFPINKPGVLSRMDMLKSMYDRIPPGQRTRVAEWAKDQITQNYFNCSIKPWVYATLSKKSQKSIDKIYVHTYSSVSITSEAITVWWHFLCEKNCKLTHVTYVGTSIIPRTCKTLTLIYVKP